ncbi:MAG: hypothetical protein KAI47_12850 [Deltaproteobacteria bacterium]|nr:hypothetical protein [Deltaproteobacteria bacterium]
MSTSPKTHAARWLTIALSLGLVIASIGDVQARGRRTRNARRTRTTTAKRLRVTHHQRPSAQAAAVDPNRGLAKNLKTLIQEHGLTSFTKNGKLYFATKANKVMPDYTKLGKNVVEFFITPGFHHLYTRVGEDVYSRIGGLTKSTYRDSSSEKIGVLVELKPAEMQKLLNFVTRAHANPSAVIGSFSYNGGRPPEKSNCTSYITYAEVGDRGQTLGAVCGTFPSGFPQGFLSSMMRSSSDRIKAVVVHNPTSTFNSSYALNLR